MPSGTASTVASPVAGALRITRSSPLISRCAKLPGWTRNSRRIGQACPGSGRRLTSPSPLSAVSATRRLLRFQLWPIAAALAPAGNSASNSLTAGSGGAAACRQGQCQCEGPSRATWLQAPRAARKMSSAACAPARRLLPARAWVTALSFKRLGRARRSRPRCPDMRTIREPQRLISCRNSSTGTHAMDLLRALNLQRWVDDNRHLLKPPVGNKLIYRDSEFLVMAVGGPQSLRDIHVEPGAEVFQQLLGDMVLRVYEGRAVPHVPTRAREDLLLPPRVPHSPQRPAHSVGLVIERARRPGERDGLQWYCEHCGALLYEEYLELKDIETQFPPVFDRYYNNLDHRRCRQCGTVAPGATAAPGGSDDAAR